MGLSNQSNRLLLAVVLVVTAPACTRIAPPPAAVSEQPPIVETRPGGHTLEEAVAMLRTARHLIEVERLLGAGHGRIRYRPGHPEDPFPANWSRHAWSNTLSAHPKRLFATLAENTPARLYHLTYVDGQVAGMLVVFEGPDGGLLGWAYNRDLATPQGRRQVWLDTR